MNARTPLAWAGALGTTGVVLGAFGAHGLRAALEASKMLDAWRTASQYQLLHACALLGLAAWIRATGAPATRPAAWAVRLMALGTVCFCGSIYALALGGPRWLGPVTPLGGLCMISGWALAAFAAL